MIWLLVLTIQIDKGLGNELCSDNGRGQWKKIMAAEP